MLGPRMRGRPVPKGMQELNQLHKCPGLRRNPWQWYESAGPTGDRHDAHVASREHVYHRDGASASRVAHGRSDGTTGTTGDRKLRAEARCWCLGIKNGCLRVRWFPALPERGRARQRRSAATRPHRAPPARASSIETTGLAGYHPSRRPVGTAYDRARIGTRTARTSLERISGPRLPRRGAQAGGGPTDHRILL